MNDLPPTLGSNYTSVFLGFSSKGYLKNSPEEISG